MQTQTLCALRERLQIYRRQWTPLSHPAGRPSRAQPTSQPQLVFRQSSNASKRLMDPPGLLVNNAGLLGPLGPLYNNDPNEWWRCLKVNLAGPMRMMQAVLQACYDGTAAGSSMSRAVPGR